MSVTQLLFIAFLLVMALIVIGAIYRALGVRTAALVASVLSIWFLCVAVMSYLGLIQGSDSRPPAPVLVLGPVLVYLVIAVWFSITKSGKSVAMAFAPAFVVALQAFRIIVEIFIHRLYEDGLAPKVLTYSGANVDIYVGITALIIAPLVAYKRLGSKSLLVWNVVGLVALANVVVRAILSAPGPLNVIHTEPPNLMISTFPYMYIPAFFVPLAVTLHIISAASILRVEDSD